MARHGGPMKVAEKSRDFKGSIKRLFNSLNTFKYFLIISLILAMISAILALVAPNKLSDLTDTITLGISPNLNEEIVKDIMADENISSEDKKQFQELLEYSKEEDVDLNKISTDFDKLPKSIYEIVKPKIDMARVKSIAIFLGILYLVSAIFNYVQSILMTITSNKFAKKLRSSISKKINKLPLKYFDTHETGDVLSRVTNDVDMIAHNLNHSLTSLVS